ncbi:MAG: hypothetical protein ACI87N_002600 [Flavobacteriales bacterium]|jgi:hypothetical protein
MMSLNGVLEGSGLNTGPMFFSKSQEIYIKVMAL